MPIELRPKRDVLYINIAQIIAQRGTCQRLNVGCLIVRDGRIICSGYNGPSKNEDHCNDYQCDLTKPCERSIHAEANAISWAIKSKIDLKGTTLYCTHAPCISCASYILYVGIFRVVYNHEFRDNEGIKYLSKFLEVGKI